ncbi:MAG: glycoside hydrolase family 25 protein [Methylobacteriaceae bacterium]|nr:glycoside hydrolase family 25 protein [Methylobacteriaceae bacterium]
MRFLGFVGSVAGLLLLAGCATLQVAEGPRPSDFLIHGVDVSKYQGEIDWPAARDSGVSFAWIKATEGGDYTDEYFDRNWQAAKAAGIPRGAYHFAYWCRPGSEQVEWFEKHVPIEDDALPPVLDVEWTPTSRTCPRKVSRETALAQMQVILTEMERYYGKRPVIYTTVDFYRDVLDGGAFEDYPIWVRSVKHYPSVKYGDRRWHFWQYTAQGNVPGIKGYVDRNAFFGDGRQWQAFLDGPKS